MSPSFFAPSSPLESYTEQLAIEVSEPPQHARAKHQNFQERAGRLTSTKRPQTTTTPIVSTKMKKRGNSIQERQTQSDASLLLFLE